MRFFGVILGPFLGELPLYFFADKTWVHEVPVHPEVGLVGRGRPITINYAAAFLRSFGSGSS